MKIIIIALLIASVLFVHYRGRVRHKWKRQIKDHSTFLAPLNSILYLTSKLPSQPFYSTDIYPELKVFEDKENWQKIKEEGIKLLEAGNVKGSDKLNDAGFNSFFRKGWKRFYLKWYGESHPSAMELCPFTTALVRDIPTVKAAMFTELPPGARLVTHRDPYAGSLRYHLGLDTPNDDRCFIEVDGERYSWRDGEGVIFDETYIHYAENMTDHRRLIFFCDMDRPLKYRWATAFNHWVGKHIVAAAASPNCDGDKTGGINKAFGLLYKIRERSKRIKEQSRFRYYLEQWLLLALVVWIIWII